MYFVNYARVCAESSCRVPQLEFAHRSHIWVCERWNVEPSEHAWMYQPTLKRYMILWFFLNYSDLFSGCSFIYQDEAVCLVHQQTPDWNQPASWRCQRRIRVCVQSFHLSVVRRAARLSSFVQMKRRFRLGYTGSPPRRSCNSHWKDSSCERCCSFQASDALRERIQGSHDYFQTGLSEC